MAVGLERLRGESSKNFICVSSNQVIRAPASLGFEPGPEGGLPSSFVVQTSRGGGVCTQGVDLETCCSVTGLAVEPAGPARGSSHTAAVWWDIGCRAKGEC